MRVARADADFDDWAGLLALLHAAFAGMEGRINPPSSLHRLDAPSLASKAGEETLVLAHDADGRLVGCVFLKHETAALYVGKLAVTPEAQGRGIGRALMRAAEAEARTAGLRRLRLQTRVELTENHETFAAMGFVETARTSHAGFDRPTTVEMMRLLD